MDLQQASARAAEAIRALPRGSRWFLAADSDADGVCAAGVMAVALLRAGYAFQVRNSRQKDADYYRGLVHQECDGYMLLDKGSSHVDVLSDVHQRTGRPVLLIDHHELPVATPDDVVVVNPRVLGMDGSRDASAATTALAVALALDARNLDLAGAALAGAVGDWQHSGGWQGWNADIIARAKAAGHLEEQHAPALVGLDLVDALTHTHPPTPGLDDDHDAARAFLAALGLDDVRDVEELDTEQRGTLLSAWSLHHLAHGSPPETLDRLTWPVLADKRTGHGVRHQFRLMDACGRMGRAADGLAWLMGDRSAHDAVQATFDEYGGQLRDALGRLRAEGTETRTACQVAWTETPALTGMVGGIGMRHTLNDRLRPIVVLAKRPDGDIQVSTRGTNQAVAAGLDLGPAVRHAAAAVGRDGGGHPVASGAVIAAADVDTFLEALDNALQRQPFMANTQEP